MTRSKPSQPANASHRRPPIPLSPGAPQDYWGLQQIADRMGVRIDTIRRWHRTKSFPLIRRGLSRSAPNLRNRGWRVWYTNEALIQHWWERVAHAQWEAEFGDAQKGEKGSGSVSATTPTRPE